MQVFISYHRSLKGKRVIGIFSSAQRAKLACDTSGPVAGRLWNRVRSSFDQVWVDSEDFDQELSKIIETRYISKGISDNGGHAS